MLASERGHLAVVDLLLENNVMVDFQNAVSTFRMGICVIVIELSYWLMILLVSFKSCDAFLLF